MINEFSDKFLLNFLIFFVINFVLFFLINFILLKQKFLIDQKSKSSHKQLINNELVPISGGIVLFVNCFLMSVHEKIRDEKTTRRTKSLVTRSS